MKKANKKKTKADDDLEDYFPWEHVEACRYNKRDFENRYDLAELIPKFKTCPKCGSLVERFYFVSPDQTWKDLCGRAGWMEACFKCKKQIVFEGGVMS